MKLDTCLESHFNVMIHVEVYIIESFGKVKNMMIRERPTAPIAQSPEINIAKLEIGKVVLEMKASEKLHNPMGTLRGGVLCDLADLAMGYAFFGTLEDNELFTTVEIKLNFLKPIWKANSWLKAKL
ncbi:PaaI family thioesterase [Sporosarcina soli]|uniref:PaaI family thioesterase n=1 Tax=Sporosarcina soli TaxID=334736 RepID=A0ABW0TDQ9_9BACL